MSAQDKLGLGMLMFLVFFVIAFLLGRFGSQGVFVFIAGAMIVVMATIGFFGPHTSNISLERISSWRAPGTRALAGDALRP